jgi:GNAT superfamily N-acetyltransferase
MLWAQNFFVVITPAMDLGGIDTALMIPLSFPISEQRCWAHCPLRAGLRRLQYQTAVAGLGRGRYRGRGIGTALLKRAIAHLDSRGVRSIKLDATPAGKPLYERLGFVSEYDVERWSLRRPHVDAVTAIEKIELDDVLSWDRQVFGVDRSPLLLSLQHEEPQFSVVARRGSKLEGYAFGRRGSLADQLGPWVAISEAAAAVTLDQFLRRSRRETLFVDCVNRTVWSRSLVKSRGFTFVRPLTRMYRGSNDYPGMPNLVGGISGPDFG